MSCNSIYCIFSCYTDRWLDNNPPSNNDLLIDNIYVASFDEKGGKLYVPEHGVTVTVPSGAVPSGKRAEMKFAAAIIAPVKFPDNVLPVSAIVWLCMDVKLQKPIQLQMPHFVNVESKDCAKILHFAKAVIHLNDEKSIATMKVINGGDFPTGESYGMIEIDHFCYYCITENILAINIPENLYQIVSVKELQPNLATNLWIIFICIIPSLPTCLKVYYLLCFAYVCMFFFNYV